MTVRQVPPAPAPSGAETANAETAIGGEPGAGRPGAGEPWAGGTGVDESGIDGSGAAAARRENGPKRTVEGVVVKVLLHARDERGMRLEAYASRCVRAGEVHELVTTDQCCAAPGERIDRVGFLGFAEITRAGVVDRGDAVRVAGEVVGTVLGFDACHFPNHYNILIAAPERRTGGGLGLAPGSAVSFEQRQPPADPVPPADPRTKE